jgi:small subunit ribosomal protein S2
MESSLRREYRKILRNLSGIRTMDRLPGALFVVDVRREIIGIKEARKLGIPVIALIDTDSDPDMVDIAIPGNDDAMRAIELVLKEIGDSVTEGKAGRAVKEERPAGVPDKDAPQNEGGRPRGRGRRTTTQRAEEEASEKPSTDAPAETAAPAANA